MIKKLIDDLANDHITLTQALTRGKILAFQLDNVALQSWLKNELEGYENHEDLLPDYRKIKCEPKITISDRWGRSRTLPLNFSGWPELGEKLSNREMTLGIPALESNYATLGDSQTGMLEFPADLIQMLYEPLRLHQQGLKIQNAGQEIHKIQLKNIIELTKQKFIDTLLQLNKEFSELNDDFKMDKEKTDKIQNIVTNNIYGNNNPVNLAAGQNVKQTDFTFNSAVNYNELEKLGVEQPFIDELRLIVNQNQHDKPTLQSRVMHWLGGVSSSLASKGLIEHMPAIIEFVQQHIK